MYTKFDYGVWQVASLSADLLLSRKLTLGSNDPLYGYRSRVGIKKDQVIYCRYRGQGTSAVTLTSVHKWACLQDRDGDGNFDKVVYPAKTGKKLKSGVVYTTSSVNTSPGQLEVFGGHHYRKEVLFQGAAGGVLRLLYREFTNDMARPAFTQELTFDLPEAPLTIAVKKLKLEVLSAGNDGISYKVLAGFSE